MDLDKQDFIKGYIYEKYKRLFSILIFALVCAKRNNGNKKVSPKRYFIHFIVNYFKSLMAQ